MTYRSQLSGSNGRTTFKVGFEVDCSIGAAACLVPGDQLPARPSAVLGSGLVGQGHAGLARPAGTGRPRGQHDYLARRRRAPALGALVVFVMEIFIWGSSSNVCDDLDAAARFTGNHVLASAGDVAAGDDGIDRLLRAAFAFAED